ncbi:MAG: hypothetical protein ACK56I_31045, partial [bacterium]
MRRTGFTSKLVSAAKFESIGEFGAKADKHLQIFQAEYSPVVTAACLTGRSIFKIVFSKCKEV